MRMQIHLILAAVALAAVGALSAYAADDDAIIKNALSAAPDAVGKNASVVTFDDKMQLVTLKKGTNNFTCIPNDPTTPSNDPMCVDENGLAFVLALIAKQPPAAGKIGFGYMLQGETAASNTDPFAPPRPMASGRRPART